MREEDTLYFSPNYTFAKLADALHHDDKEKLIEMFKDRVYGFYLDPAMSLNNKKSGFSCGLLCVATIDFLSRMEFPKYKNESKPRIKRWLKERIGEFKGDCFAKRFYKDFRCGLVHEGRIKPFGEFSYQQTDIISKKDNVIRIHPGKLLERIEEAFEEYLIELKEDSDAFYQFRNRLNEDFGPEAASERI